MCNQAVFEFQDHNRRKVTASFDGGHLSSDAGGSLLLRELERHTGIIGSLADCFTDYRDPNRVEHSLEELLRQRIGALALGYEDLNDHDRLRYDPALALMTGKDDVEGLDRSRERDKGKALAAHSTLNRFELGALGGDVRYKKIIPDITAIEALWIQEGVRAIPRRSRRIVQDFDATDDPLHGAQEGRFFHGYYGHYCYLPLCCFCGNAPLWAWLGSAQRDASEREPLMPWKRSFRLFVSVLGARYILSCVETVASHARQLCVGVSSTKSLTVLVSHVTGGCTKNSQKASKPCGSNPRICQPAASSSSSTAH